MLADKGSGDRDQFLPIKRGQPRFVEHKGNLSDGIGKKVRVEDDETLNKCSALSNVRGGGRRFANNFNSALNLREEPRDTIPGWALEVEGRASRKKGMPVNGKDSGESISIRNKGRFEKVALFRVILDFEKVEADAVLGTHVLFGRSKGFLVVKCRGQGEKSGVIMFDYRRAKAKSRGDFDNTD